MKQLNLKVTVWSESESKPICQPRVLKITQNSSFSMTFFSFCSIKVAIVSFDHSACHFSIPSGHCQCPLLSQKSIVFTTSSISWTLALRRWPSFSSTFRFFRTLKIWTLLVLNPWSSQLFEWSAGCWNTFCVTSRGDRVTVVKVRDDLISDVINVMDRLNWFVKD